MNLQELMQRRAQLIAEARSVLDAAQHAGRTLNDNERERLDTIEREVNALSSDIDRNARWLDHERALQDSAGRITSASDAEIGMSTRDAQRYSIVRAIRAMTAHLTGSRNALQEAAFELEASAAVAKRVGREPKGFFVPLEVQRQAIEQRDLVTSTNTAGGYTVATDLLAQSFIELLRNRLVVQAAGATVLSDLQGNVAIPRQTGGATAYWVAENATVTESQQAFDQVTLTPKTVGAFTDYSRRLLAQSSIDVEAFVRSDLATVLALAIDRAALHGTGASNQPLGIASTTGIGSVAGGTNGAAPTFAHIVSLETEVAIDNADLGALAYITNARVRGRLKTTEKAINTAQFVWSDGPTPLNGYPAFVSNQVRNDLDKGTSVGVCSAIFFGNWRDLLIGMWGTLDILVDPYTGSTAGTTRVVAMQDVDIAVRHPESFAAMLDALTA